LKYQALSAMIRYLPMCRYGNKFVIQAIIVLLTDPTSIDPDINAFCETFDKD
jgi:hypothetical protein